MNHLAIREENQATRPFGFESPVQPANSWELANGSGSGNLAGSQWTIAGGAGIARNLSAWQNGSPGQVPAPEGQQLAVIQGDGSFTQTVSGFKVGQTYELSLLAMGRQTSDLGGDLKAILDAGLGSEQSLIDIPEVMFPRFTELNSPSFVATKTSYTLTILSDQNIGTVLFDDVTFRLVSPPIVIDGSAASGANGLEFTEPGGVDSLTVNGFAGGAGILINAAGSFVDRVWSGVGATGTSAASNLYGVRVESGGNTIQNSLLSGNTLAGIRVLSADDNIITDNLIGTDPSRAAALANGTNGIEIDAANGTQVIDNIIACNSEDGVVIINASSGNTISNNSIHSNGQLGIDLGNDGVTANDNLDADTGANDLTNIPVLTSAAAVPVQPHILFHDTFDDSVSTSLTDPSTRATGTLADALAYNFTSATSGELEVTAGQLDWTGAILANGNLVTSNGKQNWTFRSAANPNTHFDWAPHLAGDVYDVSFTYRSAWSHPLTFGISDTPQPGDAQADNSGSYDYAFGAWGRNWDSGEDGNHNRTSGADGDTEFSILLKINEPAGTAEAWVDGSLVITEPIDFENPGRYFSFGDANSYGGYIDDFKVFVMPTGTTTTIVGVMNGLANTDYEVELFANSQVDPSGYGEGRTLLGTSQVTTDASGTIEFSTTLNETIPLGDFITATATDPSGNTSEFSVAAEVRSPELTVTIAAASIGEGDGPMATTATVSRNTDTTNALTVTLTSSDMSEARVPMTVEIPAGQTTSAPFHINAEDDATVDGTQTVTITASAEHHANGTDNINVNDDEVNDNAPYVNDATFEIPENSWNNTPVGQVVFDDDDGDGVSLEISSGNINGAFRIEADGRIFVTNQKALNFETTPTFTLTILATDNGIPSRTGTGTVTIHLTNRTETDIALIDIATGTTTLAISQGFSFQYNAGPDWNGLGITDVFSGDFTGDGLQDIAGVSDSGGFYVSENSASGYLTPVLWLTVPTADLTHDLNVGDFNGDGKQDFAARGSDGRWRIQRSTGTSFSEISGPRWAIDSWKDGEALVGDFNGDGKDDIALRQLVRQGYTTSQWYFALGTEASLITAYAGAWNERIYSWNDLRVGDFNGDGRDDIIARMNLGGWFALQMQSGSNRFQMRFAGKWSSALDWRDVTVGDFNGDGKDDIAGWEERGLWWGVYGSEISSPIRFLGAWNKTTNWATSSGDFNGDGLSDMVGFNQDTGHAWALLSLGNSFTATTFFGITTPFHSWKLLNDEFE